MKHPDDDELTTWLATVELPPGPLRITANKWGAVYWTLTDPEVWRRACLRDLFPPDHVVSETVMSHVAAIPEMSAPYRRYLLRDIASVREALRLGRPLTPDGDGEIRLERMERP